ncbi:hypothetical protein A0H81_01447 [Grifola frondosa]|uniref:Uncharacterized protein n=1 Tax=Grifola frondosa TaxID=5627 RepID=A0A1C7MPQ8_GRIFR|nr:hypothetical protein A0H81_01447 [Grifola frondosa]
MSTVLLSSQNAADRNDTVKDKGEFTSDVSSIDVPSLGAPIDHEPRRPFWRRVKKIWTASRRNPQYSMILLPWNSIVLPRSTRMFIVSILTPDGLGAKNSMQRLVRRIDWLVMIWAFIMFFSLDLDRSNISQANTDNFLNDLKMTTDDFNLGNTLFRLCFLIAELPSQLISKRVGPDIWVPSQMVLWSFVSLGQFWLKGRGSFLATRCLLGFMQGGFIPDVILYLSYFYTKTELPIRLAWFWVSNYMSHIMGLPCYWYSPTSGPRRLCGLALSLPHRRMSDTDRRNHLLLHVAPKPTQTKTWFRPKGWFTEREEIIIVNRVLRDDPSKSNMHNREGLTPKMIWKVIKDWRMWPLYVLGVVHMIPVTPPQTYLTLSLRNLGFNTTESNLLSIPSTVLGTITLLISCYLSEIIDSRVIATVILQFWALPLLIALYTFTAHTPQWVYFAVVSLITGYPYVHPVQVAWASTNSYGVGTRTVSASIYNMFVQAGAIISANIYRTDDQPLVSPFFLRKLNPRSQLVLRADKRGNRALIAITVMNIFIYAFTYFFYRAINKRRNKVWSSWTTKQQQEYLDTTKDEGNTRLNFRFTY